MHDEMTIWYLHHSGFAVQTDHFLLIFDYWNDEPNADSRTLDDGVFDPETWLEGWKAIHPGNPPPRVVVFSSHKHGDHFNPIILAWAEILPDICFVFSHDIPKRHFSKLSWQEVAEPVTEEKRTEDLLSDASSSIIRIKPGRTWTQPDTGLVVHAFQSTDAGVAFWVETGFHTLYHAGDLNWWHWEEESRAWNNHMAARYKKEVSLISSWSLERNLIPDVAFLPTDPRLESHWLDGCCHFLNEVGAQHVIPMHFWDQFEPLSGIPSEWEERLTSPLPNLLLPERRGQSHLIL